MKIAIKQSLAGLRNRKSILFLLLFCTAVFLFSAVFFLFNRNPQSAARALIFLFLLLLIPPIERMLRMEIPTLCYALLLYLLFGSFLGSCFDFYFRISFWDTLLHGLSGMLFACIGYAICKLLFSIEENANALPCIFVGITFSLSIALLWELFEAGATYLFAVDMQEDTLLTSFKSFYLSGTHGHVTHVEKIHKTVIFFENGESLHLSGYLDLGLADTLGDMAVCFLGNLFFLLLFPLDALFRGKILSALLPKILKKT